jgi:hypothetical protein
MRLTLLLLLATLLLFAAPAPADEWWELDTGLVAQTLTGESRTVEAASWQVLQVREYRGWLDAFGIEGLATLDFSDAGAGVSFDGGSPVCIGAGYYRGWIIYAGVHVALW